MAKRKRLSPANPGAFVGASFGETGSKPPIADVAGQAASQAALDEMADELSRARREGRMVVNIRPSLLVATHLVRDRTHLDEDEMEALVASIRVRGQQTPIEVVELDGGGFGLISGWRRVQAIGRLLAEATTPEEQERFATVKALIRRPETAADAYVAMVEENEIRAGLSLYEKARIAAKAVEQGVYSDRRAALAGLYANAPAPKRSKIAGFMQIYDVLDGHLRHPEAIPERLGLALAKAIDSGGLMTVMRALAPLPQDRSVEVERKALEQSLTQQGAKTSSPPKITERLRKAKITPTLRLEAKQGHILLAGKGADLALEEDLKAWLTERYGL